MTTALRTTLFSGETVATRKPALVKINALGGTLRPEDMPGNSKLTLANPPGIKVPLAFSAESCTSILPEPALMA